MYSHGLNALAYIVSHRGAQAYGREANARMRAAAVRTLASPLHELGIHLVVPSAMRLAFALGDPESLGAIAALTDADQIRAQGVTDPQQIEQLQKRATDVLAGKLVLWPRRRNNK